MEKLKNKAIEQTSICKGNPMKGVGSMSKTHKNLRKSELEAGDICVYVVKAVTTGSSPGVFEVDLKTSGIIRSVVSSKSHH